MSEIRRHASPGKRPLWQRTLDRMRYGFGAAGKARKRKAEAAARAAAFESLVTDQEGALPRRHYASYEDYVAHQGSKLAQIERRLRRVEGEDLDSFRTSFGQCIELKGRHTVLCLGARIGTEVRALIELGHLAVGVDLNPGAANPYVLYGDFHHLVFPDHSFAAVYTNTLDHVFDLKQLIGEIRRVLEKGGVFIADVVLGINEGHLPGEFESTFWGNIDELVGALTKAGLQLETRRALAHPLMHQIVMTVAPSHLD